MACRLWGEAMIIANKSFALNPCTLICTHASRLAPIGSYSIKMLHLFQNKIAILTKVAILFLCLYTIENTGFLRIWLKREQEITVRYNKFVSVSVLDGS